MNKSEVLKAMSASVIDGNTDDARKLAEEWLKLDDSNPLEAIENGYTPGMQEVGRLYEEGEYFLPELIGSAEAMKAAMSVFRPVIIAGAGSLDKGTVIMASVEGDIHEIGKSVVSAILEAKGFRVFDLGPSVKMDFLYQKVRELKPDVVGLSALLTTTMINQKNAVTEIENMKMGTKVIVGGAPVSRKWADEIGADGYGKDAFEAAELVASLLAS